MEESISSSMSSAFYCKEIRQASSEEESGWTMYFDDFLTSEEEARKEEEDGVSASASMVSNAVVSATGNTAAKGTKKKVKIEKRRNAWGALDEDPLADTASSPANTTQVDSWTRYEMNQDSKKMVESYKHDVWNIGYGQGSVHWRENVNGLGQVDRTAPNECTELQKRGLCLVPFSLFVDHHLV